MQMDRITVATAVGIIASLIDVYIKIIFKCATKLKTTPASRLNNQILLVLGLGSFVGDDSLSLVDSVPLVTCSKCLRIYFVSIFVF